MSKVEELENEVLRLSRAEFDVFRDWFRKYDSDQWDKEIEEDVLAGRLDSMAAEAKSDSPLQVLGG